MNCYPCLQPSDFFLYNWVGPGGDIYIVDWMAFALTILLTMLLCFGLKESQTANTVITILHIGVMIFIIIAGFTQADKDK